MSYKHITPEQRNELAVLLRAGHNQKEIAELLKKDKSTISRELSRNPSANKIGYSVKKAKQNSKEKRIQANARFRKLENNIWLQNYVIKKLKRYWSPEQISGRLKNKYSEDKKKWIGKDSIYNFIYEEKKDLVKYLRCQKGKYRRRRGTKIREKQREMIKKRRIDERPGVINNRKRVGDWEGDTIVGAEKNIHILTHTERKSGKLLADKLERATAELTKEKTVERFKKIQKKKRRSCTYDNGVTFAEHEITEKETGMTIYFAHPYHSWERGTSENTNGLLRQFFPKGSSFDTVTQEDIDRACSLINNRPRKRLNYFTPNEIFNK